jgi:hypothetical protein
MHRPASRRARSNRGSMLMSFRRTARLMIRFENSRGTRKKTKHAIRAEHRLRAKPPIRRPYDANSSNNSFASFRSRVSKPSANHRELAAASPGRARGVLGSLRRGVPRILRGDRVLSSSCRRQSAQRRHKRRFQFHGPRADWSTIVQHPQMRRHPTAAHG